jgi:glycosyltransferase involved in cell wall biosynthesis
MRVLFVNHTGRMSGAEYSLLELAGGLAGELECELACPEGPLASEALRRGLAVHRIRGTDGSLRLHPRHTPAALADIARAAGEIRRLARGRRVDLVHANSIRAGLAAGPGRLRPSTAPLGRVRSTTAAPPLVTHVRDCLPAGRVSESTKGLLGRLSTVLIANSRYTRERGVAPAAQGRTEVVYSPVDLDRFDPERLDRERFDPEAARCALGLDPRAPVLGVVAQVTPWKGQLDAVRALGQLDGSHDDATLLLVGSPKFTSAATRYDNVAYLAEIRREIAALGLGRRVRLLGEREDVPEVMRALDVLLVPSWEEPCGRSVLEGMAMGVPVLATARGGPAEIVRDGRDGRVLAPRDPRGWARVVAELLGNPAGTAAMGASARVRAREHFGLAAHVAGVLHAYELALSTATVAEAPAECPTSALGQALGWAHDAPPRGRKTEAGRHAPPARVPVSASIPVSASAHTPVVELTRADDPQ